MEQNEKCLKLIKRAMRGKPDAYGELISLHQEYMYKMAFLYMKNQDDALDVVGTTILKGYQSIKSLKRPKLFKTWITRILINVANDELKKVIYYCDIDTEEISQRHKGVSLEEKMDIQNAIERLPDRFRNVIILKYFGEMTIGEISYTLSVPEGTVKSYLSRGREELKKYLKEDYLYAEHI